MNKLKSCLYPLSTCCLILSLKWAAAGQFTEGQRVFHFTAAFYTEKRNKRKKEDCYNLIQNVAGTVCVNIIFTYHCCGFKLWAISHELAHLFSARLQNHLRTSHCWLLKTCLNLGGYTELWTLTVHTLTVVLMMLPVACHRNKYLQ